MTHSKLPWKLVEKHIEDIPSGWDIASSDSDSLFGGDEIILHGAWDDSSYNGDNMEFIVKCVNSHDKLVEALRALASAVEEKGDEYSEELDVCTENAWKTLQQVKGE